MTTEEAWDIAVDFAKHLEHSRMLFAFEDSLPYPKDKILLALFALLKAYRDDEELFEIILSNLLHLTTDFIPSKEDFETKRKMAEDGPLQ